MATRAEKLTISVPRNILIITDEIARERKLSRSKLVSSCLKEMIEKHLNERMAEGYKEMAERDLKFAEQSLPLVNEILNQQE